MLLLTVYSRLGIFVVRWLVQRCDDRGHGGIELTAFSRLQRRVTFTSSYALHSTHPWQTTQEWRFRKRFVKLPSFSLSYSQSNQDPTFEPVVTEKTALFQELQEEDLYIKYKKLSRHLELLEIQEGYIKDEQASLKRELIRAQEEVRRIQSVPLVIGQFLEPIDQHTGIVGSTTGSNYVVRILSTLDRELLKPSSSVALHRHSNALVDILPPEADSSIAMLGAEEKPDVTYQDVGGMDTQKQEIREAVELPLTHYDLYKKIGIDPPRGVLLYGPPGMPVPRSHSDVLR